MIDGCRYTSWSEFTFYASGRKNCFYSLYKLDLDKRHCFFSSYVLGLLSPAQDILTVDMPIRYPNSDFESAPPYPVELFLTQKSRSKGALEIHEHFKNFLTAVKANNLPVPAPPANKKEARELSKKDYLIVLAENEEVANQVIDKSIGDILQKYGDCLQELHVTDQKVYNKYPVFMRARIEVGSTDESMSKALKVLQAVFTIVDKVVRMKLSDSARAKCEKNRRNAPSADRKEEEERKEQDLMEKLRREQVLEREKLAKMTPE